MLREFIRLPRSVHILCLGTLINRAGTFLLPFLAIYLKQRGLSEIFATFAMGLYGLGWFVASMVGGHLADHVGRKRIMMISLLGSASVLLVFPLLTGPVTILAALFVLALLAEMYRPAASAMIADITPPEHRPHAFGLMYVAINLGFTIAAVVGGIVSRISFPLLFLCDALTAAAYAMLILFTLGETLLSSVQSNTTASVNRTDESVAKPITFVAAVRHILTDRVFLACWFGSFGLSLVYVQAFSAFPLYLNRLDIESDVYGRIIAVNGILIVIVQLPMTGFITRFHRGRAVTLSAVVTAVGFAMFAGVDSAALFAVAVAVWTMGEIMNAPLMSAIVSDLAPPSLRARYMGAFANCFSLSMMIGAPLGGWVLESWGGPTLWILVAGMALCSAAAYALVRNRVTSVPGARPPAESRSETGFPQADQSVRDETPAS